MEIVFFVVWMGSDIFPTQNFTVMEPQNPAIHGYYLDQKCPSTDLEALEWRNVRSEYEAIHARVLARKA